MRQFEDDDDFEGPDASEQDWDIGNEQPEMSPCPYCREEIYEEAERCPHCGKYISEEDSPSDAARWFKITVVLCIIAILLFWVGFRWIF